MPSAAATVIDRPRNLLLARLSDADLRRLRPHLNTVVLQPKQVLHKQGETIQYVYFPSGSVVSIASLLPDGAMIEAATIGNEGIVGVEAFFRDQAVSACETLAQMPMPHDTAERLCIREFRRSLASSPTFHEAVARYIEVLYAVMGRLMACTAHHPVDERCARWLLTMHDRMGNREFHLSHEFLAAMLGVRRQTVTGIAGALRTAGFIRYSHGRVTVMDRAGLESAACGCYPAIRALYDRLKIVNEHEWSSTGQYSGFSLRDNP